LDVLHELRPATVEREGARGDEECEQYNDSEQHSRFDERASGLPEELLGALRRASPQRRSPQPRADHDAVLATRSAGTNRA
jgi:hypothetical protein